MDKTTYFLNIRGLMLAGGNFFSPVKGKEMASLPILENAWLKITGNRIVGMGRMEDLDRSRLPASDVLIDAKGKYVLPGFCDSHTHLVYAGSREQEFTDKIRGLSYEEIARRGGGILNSAARLRNCSEKELYDQSVPRLQEIMQQGTTAVEIKSGYGLTVADEIKMLRVIRSLQRDFPIEIRSTFLGAHAFPLEYKDRHDEYVNLIIQEMIPAIANEELADYIDVFCDTGFFSVTDTERILMAGLKFGIRPKIHANELDVSGGVQVGVKYDALSVDHLERIGAEEIEVLKNSSTIPTLLPGAAFFLSLPDPPARSMIEQGLPVAIASDCNPGSSPSGNMKLMMSLACIKLKMQPLEALCAATINGACAMELEKVAGSIDVGKQANLILTKAISSFDFFPYAYGSDLIEKVMIKGEFV